MYHCWSEDKKDHIRRNTGKALGSREWPELTASKEAGVQSYNHKELDPANDMNEFGSRIIPTTFREEPS